MKKQLVVDGKLHKRLKAEAQAEGRKLYALVEDLLAIGLASRKNFTSGGRSATGRGR